MSSTTTQLTENAVSSAILRKEPLRPSTVQPEQTTACYRALSPDGRQIVVPQELFVALSDFLKTRKCPGSVTIDFHCDEIVGVEALTKKRLPSKR